MKYLALFPLSHLALSHPTTPKIQDCPPGIIPTPSYGTKGAVFSVCSAININAPQRKIYSIIKNFDEYPKWDTFVTSVTAISPGPYRLNSTFTMHSAYLIPLVLVSSDERISIWNQRRTNSRGQSELHVAWGSFPATPEQSAEHVTLVRDLGNGTCTVVSWETYYGTTAPVIEGAVGVQLRFAFGRQNEDLKAFAEAEDCT